MSESDRELTAKILAAHGRAEQKGGDDEAQVRAWYFFYLYNQEHGVFGNRRGNPHRMSRREWMERLLRIVDKNTRTVPFKLNRSQRMLEARVLRAERTGKPVRIVILKVRQNGISSYVIGFWLWAILTRQNVKAQIVTHEEKLYAELLKRLRSMFGNLAQSDGTPWDLPTTSKSRNLIEFGPPFDSAVNVVTARSDDPGFGQTPTLLDMEETAKWPDAEEKAKGIVMGLPEVSGTVAFDISQPSGNTGYFAAKYRGAEKKKQGLAAPKGDDVDESLFAGWDPLFMPWYIHDEEYRWTKIGGNPPVLPKAIEQKIERTLDEEETLLLKQRFYERGRPGGWRNVDYDQLAWRRYYIEAKLNGNIESFHEQCPAFPDEAFLSSGRPFFNSQHVRRAMASHEREPIAIGSIVAGPAFSPWKHGALWIWAMPKENRSYAIGVDTASGVRGGDPCVATIVDIATDEIVAEWYGWEPPPAFGITVAALSDFYHAETAIETHPSPHGLAVFDAAEQAGCKRLFVQQVPHSRIGQFQTRKGWVMSAQAKYDVMHRVARALLEETPIPSHRLLGELLDARIDEKDTLDNDCRNDLIMAYGIALRLADKNRMEQIQEPKQEKLPPPDSDEYFFLMKKRERTQQVTYDQLTGHGI